MQFVIAQGDRLAGADFLIQHIQYPAAEFFSQRRAREHGDQMGSTQGEDAMFHLYCPCFSNGRQIDGRCHIWGKFVGITDVDAANGVFSGIAEGLGDLGGSQPRLAIVRDDGEVGVMKADAVHGLDSFVQK